MFRANTESVIELVTPVSKHRTWNGLDTFHRFQNLPAVRS
jgi:hypothetical protein